MVSPQDTVLVAGDISWGMSYEEALPDLLWLDELPGKKILIRGNHDYWWKKIFWLRKNLPPTLIALQNDFIEVEGHTITGTRGWSAPMPGSESFDSDQKLFARERIRLKLSLDSAKGKERIIVMMHYPPFLPSQDDPGFTDILESFDVDTVVYGHLHGVDGQNAFTGVRNYIRYLFTACDSIGFSPLKIV